MKKRITAFVLVVTLMFTVTVFSDYYPDDVIRADIPFSEMLGYEFDFENSLKILTETEKLIDNGAPIEKILESFDAALPIDSIDFVTRCNLDNIIAYTDNSAENSSQLTKSENYALDIQKQSLDIIKKLAESSAYKAQFIEYMQISEDELNTFIDDMPSDREYAIHKELNVLSEKYYNSVFGSYKMQYNGKEYTLENLSEIPENEYPRQLAKYLYESCDILSGIFIDIVNKRTELAKAAGYESYIEYAYTEEYPKDYSDEDRNNFYDYTAEYIVPLFKSLYNTSDLVENEDRDKDLALTEDEIVQSVRESLGNIHPELTEAFDYMKKYNLYDISESSKKRPGGFTATLDFFRVPFIFANPEGSKNNMFTTLVHEYGHFNAEFHSPMLTDAEYAGDTASNLDIAEIQSQGLELLMLNDYGKFYGNDAVYYRNGALVNTLDTIISSCVYSKWLEDVYSAAEEKELTRDILCEYYKTACQTLGVEDFYLFTGLDCEWMMIPHNFEIPFYYISYGVSAMAALELYSDSVSDRDKAIDKYMKISSKGSAVPFSQTLSDCGFSNIFAESAFDSVSDSIKAHTGLGYTDVKNSDWFYPYVLNTAYFIDGITADRFEPDTPATRLTFVEALGKMEDDINGIGSPKAVFSDTDSPYVSWAANNKIAAGISNTRFGTDMPVTREQVVCFLYRLAGEPCVTVQPMFSDRNDISDWAVNAISWAQREGIVNGYTDNTFRPKKSVTRGEVAKLIADTYKTNY